jgi:hypothetical protein
VTAGVETHFDARASPTFVPELIVRERQQGHVEPDVCKGQAQGLR